MQFGPSPTEFNALAMHCFQSNWFPSLHAMPPPTVIAIAFGTCIHAPFSFVYHWKYCTSLDHPFDRVNHISRRLDSAFIHLLCAFYSFGGSGSVGYFLISSIINAFFFAKHFDAKVRITNVWHNCSSMIKLFLRKNNYHQKKTITFVYVFQMFYCRHIFQILQDYSCTKPIWNALWFYNLFSTHYLPWWNQSMHYLLNFGFICYVVLREVSNGRMVAFPWISWGFDDFSSDNDENCLYT
mmetsp:Transcript_34097/g.78709  ORF Transcript_34097/g.78709 Transcript_34097/m.78709 type:complete len:239 (-) Transcript_34097:114-830(-)